MKKQVAVLPGDGIGQEVVKAALDVLRAMEEQFGHQFKVVEGDIGGVAIDRHGTPLPQETLELCKSSDAVLLGAVGGPKWDDNPTHLKPEKGLLGIRKELGLFANYRPIKTFEALKDASPLKRSVVDGVDFVIVRELTGGLYFGEPRERRGQHQEVAVDTLQYEKKEIENVVRKAFELAATRKKKVTSVDKANVLESSRMWREVVEQVAEEFPEVEVEHLLVDVAAMKLVYQPKQFDVIVTENMFGDILSDEASMLTGSLGMLPSASLRADNFGLYEPVHGSAPDIAGQNRANPLGMVLSVAMMLRHSFGLEEEADRVEEAVQEVLNAGYRTGDLEGIEKIGPVCTTSEMSENLVEHFQPNFAMSGILAAYM